MLCRHELRFHFPISIFFDVIICGSPINVGKLVIVVHFEKNMHVKYNACLCTGPVIYEFEHTHWIMIIIRKGFSQTPNTFVYISKQLTVESYSAMVVGADFYCCTINCSLQQTVYEEFHFQRNISF